MGERAQERENSIMASVLVVTEVSDGNIREASLELVTIARKVAESSGREVKSLVIGSGVEGVAGDFAGKGGGDPLVVDSPEAANYNVDVFKKAILAGVEAAGADLVLISNTPAGWDVAPRIAAALDCAFVSDCTNVEASGSSTTFTRRVFNGKLDAQLAVEGTAVATVQPGAVEAFSGSSDGSASKLEADLSGARAKFVEVKQSESTGIDLTKADVVVSGGRGVGDPEKFPEVIQPLADALGGAIRFPKLSPFVSGLGTEVDVSIKDGEFAWKGSGASRAKVGDDGGSFGGAIGFPEFDSVFTVVARKKDVTTKA